MRRYLLKIIRGSEDEVEYQGWADVLYNEADPVTVAIEMAGDRRREELVGYRVRKLCRAIGLGRRTDEEPALLECPVGWTADLNGHLFRFLAHGNLVALRFSQGNCIRRRRERDALGFEHDDEEVIGLIGHGRCDCGNCQTDGDEG